MPSEKWGETIKALVVLGRGSVGDRAGLIAWCKEKAAHYKALTTIEFRHPGPHRDRRLPEVQAARPTGRAKTARSTSGSALPHPELVAVRTTQL